jgi:hypothetical protein
VGAGKVQGGNEATLELLVGLEIVPPRAPSACFNLGWWGEVGRKEMVWAGLGGMYDG